MTSLVLLRDPFQDAWGWNQLALELRDMGRRVLSPGLGDGVPCAAGEPSRALLRGLERRIQDAGVSRAILVCSGYAGMLAPALAERMPSVFRRIIFLDAALPEQGKSYLDVCPPPLADRIRAHGTGDAALPFKAFEEPYAGPEQRAWPASLCLTSEEEPAAVSFGRKRAETLGVEWRCVDLTGSPVLARAGDLARVLVSFDPPEPLGDGTGCGRSRMPHDMRMAYCAHYRKRQALAETSCDSHTSRSIH
ncbi:MAG: alpha/beta fold hydrolase [Pseudodesulfovibrio sp.]|uniref:alpha/beta fold hydrolase n=1 Tax=Pseudodesulfovibrio sp. TaxID=2035812 RepID=UPI003D12F68D